MTKQSGKLKKILLAIIGFFAVILGALFLWKKPKRPDTNKTLKDVDKIIKSEDKMKKRKKYLLDKYGVKIGVILLVFALIPAILKAEFVWKVDGQYYDFKSCTNCLRYYEDYTLSLEEQIHTNSMTAVVIKTQLKEVIKYMNNDEAGQTTRIVLWSAGSFIVGGAVGLIVGFFSSK